MLSRFRTGQYGAFTGSKPSSTMTDSMSPLGKMMPPPPDMHTTGGNAPVNVGRTMAGPSRVGEVVRVPGGYAQERMFPGYVNPRADLSSIYASRQNNAEIPTLFGRRRRPGD